MEELLEIDHNKFYADRQRYQRNLAGNAYDTGASWEDYKKIDTMIRNWEHLVRHIRIESIQCKRKKKITDQYRKMMREFQQYQDEIEQAVTMYLLLYKTG